MVYTKYVYTCIYIYSETTIALKSRELIRHVICIHVYVYIHTERNRTLYTQKWRVPKSQGGYNFTHIHIYIYIHIERERYIYMKRTRYTMRDMHVV